MDKNNLQYQLYKLDDENEINVLVKDESIWLTQKSMSELFGVGVPAISKHLISLKVVNLMKKWLFPFWK